MYHSGIGEFGLRLFVIGLALGKCFVSLGVLGSDCSSKEKVRFSKVELLLIG